MRVVSQFLVALALTSCMVQISQALPAADNMVMKRDGLPLVGDLLGGTLGGGSGPATNTYAVPAGHGKKHNINNKAHQNKGPKGKKVNKVKKVKKVKKAKQTSAGENMALK